MSFGPMVDVTKKKCHETWGSWTGVWRRLWLYRVLHQLFSVCFFYHISLYGAMLIYIRFYCFSFFLLFKWMNWCNLRIRKRLFNSIIILDLWVPPEEKIAYFLALVVLKKHVFYFIFNWLVYNFFSWIQFEPKKWTKKSCFFLF